MRIVIVDDEELARKLLREYLASFEDVEIVAECANGFEAVKAVTELRPDLLLLDIQMPRLDGFEVLDLVGRVRRRGRILGIAFRGSAGTGRNGLCGSTGRISMASTTCGLWLTATCFASASRSEAGRLRSSAPGGSAASSPPRRGSVDST